MTEKLDGWGWLFLIFGGISLLNAVWMFVDPLRWYHDLPAGVPDFGPFNPHFVRDIGCAFATVGIAQVWAAFSPRFRTPLVAISAVFLVAGCARRVSARRRAGCFHLDLDAPRRRSSCDSTRLKSRATRYSSSRTG